MNVIFDKKILALIACASLAGGFIYLNQTTSLKQSGPNLFDKANEIYKNGLSLYKAQKYTQATEEFKKAISIYEKHLPAHNRLSLSYLHLGQTDAALSYAQKAIEISPNYSTSHIILGQIYEQQNKTTQALNAYETAVKLDSKLVEGHTLLAQLLAKQNTKENLEHAARHAKLAYDLQPENQNVLATIHLVKTGLDALKNSEAIS